MHRRIIFIFLLLLTAGICVDAQTNVEVFGQNRIQYRRFQWKYFEAKHFKIYHYDRAGTDLARYVAEQAEQDVTAVENRLGSRFPDWLNIIIYNSYDDYQQSNIGYNSGQQLENNPAGTVTLVGDKLTIYFTGSHADLKNQLRRGIATVVMEHLLFGDNLREMVRNAVLLNLPEWATEGYIGYVVDGWDARSDNQWKNLLADTSHKLYFDELAEHYPEVAGKAFWKYIAEKYGDNNVKNLLYLTQLKSSLNAALKLSFGQTVNQTYDSLISHYQSMYRFQSQLFDRPDSARTLLSIPLPNDESRIRSIMVSPRGFDVAYVKWRFGEYKVILQRTEVKNGNYENSTSVLLDGGVLNYNEQDDPDYPLLAWNNTGYKLGIVYKFKNRIFIKVYDAIKGKMLRYVVPQTRFDRILSFSFTDSEDVVLISGIRRGKSDLFEYKLKRKQLTQITDDDWDDLEPVFVSGGSRKGIVFLSNRPEPYINIKPLPNELPGNKFTAYFYNLTTKSMDLLPIASMPKGHISGVIPYGFDNFSFLSDANGVWNRYAVLFARTAQNMDSAYSVPMTNYEHSILAQQYNPASEKVAEVVQLPDRYAIYFRNVTLPPPAGNDTPAQPVMLPQIDALSDKRISQIMFLDEPSQQQDRKNKKQKIEEHTADNSLNITSGNAFQSEFENSPSLPESDSAEIKTTPESQVFAQKLSIKNPNDTLIVQSSTDSGVTHLGDINQNEKGKRILYVDSTYIDMRSKPYRSTFHLDFFSARIDNSIIFNRYQPYTGNAGQYQNPPLGGMFTASLVDKMEDYRFTGGIRIPLDFSSTTYLLQFQNLRRRVDWGLTFLRTEQKQNYNFTISTPQGGLLAQEPGKTITNILQGDASYPFDKVKSIRMQLGIRQDNMLVKAQDIIGLSLPSTRQYYAMSRAEFVYDDTRKPAENIWNGLRFKLYAEYMYKLYSNNKYYSAAGGFDSTKLAGFYNFGFDIRYYKKLYKNFIGAVRVSGAHSGGNEQVMYMLGGVDNPIGSSQDHSLPPSLNNTYAFQALETNLRGYNQGARNGNTFAVLNAELRLPVLTTFLRKPVRSTLLKNFQLIAFLDAGSAWEGLLPKDDRSRSNYFYYPDPYNPTITVTIPYPTPGLAVGYGVGARTMLFGYFLRVDAAWNIERDFMWHFSIGTDF